jgi:hypothetical protein
MSDLSAARPGLHASLVPDSLPVELGPDEAERQARGRAVRRARTARPAIPAADYKFCEPGGCPVGREDPALEQGVPDEVWVNGGSVEAVTTTASNSSNLRCGRFFGWPRYRDAIHAGMYSTSREWFNNGWHPDPGTTTTR